ncbi:hypothetical protein MPSEU_000203400 [Mayamaea pseudoterrestris]|nr:hypothetical protein MPSEU_000203400 [Mayamaea pseudoterrestris]
MENSSQLEPSATHQQPMPLPPDDIFLGSTRIQDASGYIATIVYYGPVASSKNPSKLYYGVIWDDSSRGKHNGSVVCRSTNRLVSHFRCTHPTAASFILPHTIDFGKPLSLQMLMQRYQDASSRVDEHTVSTSSGRSKPIEFVGREKILMQQRLTKLKQVSLRSMGISSIKVNTMSHDSDEKDTDSFDSVQHLEQMDLAGNLLSDWADVERLFQQFPNLQHLSLACNRMRRDSSEWLQKATSSFDKLVHVNVRGGVVENYKTLQQLLRVLPNLEELCAASNDLSDLMKDVDTSDAASETITFSSIRWLDVSGCKLNEDGISRLARYFPNLQWLSLDDNFIAQWPSEDASMPHLEHLQLANTKFSNWADLERLNHQLPKLLSLRLRNCPLLADLGELQTRALIIARFPTLTKVNASVVTAQERQDAERGYLLTTSRSIQLAISELNNVAVEPGGSNDADLRKRSIHDELLAMHPQYNRLLDKYPDLAARLWNPNGNSMDTNENHRGNGATSLLLADSMVSIQIRSMSAQSCTMDPLLRRLPNQLTVGRLKALCSRQFGLPVDLQNLMVCSSSSSIPVPMPDDDRSLEYYGVSDGSEILVHEMDERQLQMERKRDQQDLERRIEEQQAQLDQFQKVKDLAARQ